VQTARAVLKYADALLYRKARLSIVKLVALRALASNNGIMIPSEIAEWTQTEQHNITALIDRMKQNGLVTAKRNRSDKRVVDISLTEKGREVLSQAMPVAREAVDQVMLLITKGDAARFENTLRVLRQNTHRGLEGIDNRSQPRPG